TRPGAGPARTGGAGDHARVRGAHLLAVADSLLEPAQLARHAPDPHRGRLGGAAGGRGRAAVHAPGYADGLRRRRTRPAGRERGGVAYPHAVAPPRDLGRAYAAVLPRTRGAAGGAAGAAPR